MTIQAGSQGDDSQWIRKPRGMSSQLAFQIIEGQVAIDDPISLCQRLERHDLSVLNDYLNMWTRSICELLQKLKNTVPAEGMLAEVHYWRDMARILGAIAAELKLAYVEVVIQLLTATNDNDHEYRVFQEDVKRFMAEK